MLALFRLREVYGAGATGLDEIARAGVTYEIRTACRRKALRHLSFNW